MSIAEHGIDRVRSDGLEEAEQRLTLFQVPNRLPIGRDRTRMSHAEFARRAQPALLDAYHHEQAGKGALLHVAQSPCVVSAVLCKARVEVCVPKPQL